MKDHNVREHDGTNFRGVTEYCEVCGTPLIKASEHGVCDRCLANAKARIEDGLKKSFACLRQHVQALEAQRESTEGKP